MATLNNPPPARSSPLKEFSSVLMTCIISYFIIAGIVGHCYKTETRNWQQREVGTRHFRQQHNLPYALNDLTSDNTNNSNIAEDNAFILSIMIEFQTRKGVQHFEKLFSSMAKWVQEHEQTTTSYSFATSDKDPLKGLIFEQYVNKEAYLNVHKSSSQFLDFKKRMVAMNDDDVRETLGWNMTGQSYLLSAGFI